MEQTIMNDPDPQSEHSQKQPPENKKMSKVKNIVHLWEGQTIEELLQGVFLAALEDHEVTLSDGQTSNKSASNDIPQDIRMCDKMFCVTCSVEFSDREDQKQHFKSDWHRFNIKLKIKDQNCVSESNFEDITRTGDLSSISGSDSPSEDEDVVTKLTSKSVDDEDDDLGGGHVEGIGKRHPRVFMKNHQGELLSVYRCVIHGKKNQAGCPEELLSMVQSLPSQSVWCVIMLAGGHFAGAIFDGNKIVEHKTFHRYVVRAKRGTVQSVRDNKGHGPKSGGASIRRYNEAALATEIQELLKSWQEQIQSCHRIFLRVPTYHKVILFGGKSPILDKKDPRIRLIPFQTRRPTFKELQRVQDLLSSVECYGTESTLQDHISLSPKKSTSVVTRRVDEPVSDNILPSEDSNSSFLHNTTQDKDDTSGQNLAGALSSSDAELELYTETVTFDTTELQCFEATKRPRRKRKKKEKTKMEVNQDVSNQMDPEMLTLRNKLYTACKTNDIDKLRTLVESLRIGESTDQSIQGQSGNGQGQTDDMPDQRVNIQGQTDSMPDQRVNALQTGNSFTESVSDLPIARPSESASESGEAVTSPESGEAVTSQRPDVQQLLNCPFGENKSTLLHVASQAGHRDALSLLMEAGADPALKDQKGHVPYLVANNKDTRNEFRRFMGRFPDMYNYTKAQIPGPLSEDMERERKAKETERRKAMKKAKHERLKDQREIEAKEREEAREKQRFLSLSDREKRAMAAEKRLTSQMTSQGHTAPVLNRCFQCAADITGKVPFEYQDYKFCTPKCLKDHRLQTKQKKAS